MGDVLGQFIEPLRRVFPMPKTAEGGEAEFFRVYAEVLHTFGDETLARAATLIIANRSARSFPLPAECNHACKDACDVLAFERKGLRPNNRGENLPFNQKYPEWSEDRIKRANALFDCELGREALKEDWALSLHDWMREHGRWPDRHEAEEVRKKGLALSRKFWDTVGEEHDVGNLGPNLMLRKFIKMRQMKIDRLRSIAFRNN